jgi:hypothetical protein
LLDSESSVSFNWCPEIYRKKGKGRCDSRGLDTAHVTVACGLVRQRNDDRGLVTVIAYWWRWTESNQRRTAWKRQPPCPSVKATSASSSSWAQFRASNPVQMSKKADSSLPLTNRALRREDVWGRGCVYPCNLDLSTRRMWVVS